MSIVVSMWSALIMPRLVLSLFHLVLFDLIAPERFCVTFIVRLSLNFVLSNCIQTVGFEVETCVWCSDKKRLSFDDFVQVVGSSTYKDPATALEHPARVGGNLICNKC